MTTHRPVFAWRGLAAAVLVLTGCTFNPARNLRPDNVDPDLRMDTRAARADFQQAAKEVDEENGVTDEDLTPKDRAKRKEILDREVKRRFFDPKDLDLGLFHGKEKIDEQDFYSLIDDRTSADSIAAHRGTGVFLESLGMAGMVLGYGVALANGANWLLSTGDTPIMPRILTSDVGFFVVLLSGLVVGGLSTMAFTAGKAQASENVFDPAHATASFEVYRYGPGGLTPASIKTLEVKSAEGGVAEFCSTDEAELRLAAFDLRGKPIILEGRKDWFDWRSTPEGLLTRGEHAEDVTVRSPLERSLAGYGQTTELSVKVVGGAASWTQELKHDFTCQPLVAVRGRAGNDGSYGTPGSFHAGNGRTGTRGGDGEDGVAFDVEAARVVAPDGARYALVAISREGARDVKLVLAKEGATVKIDVMGGRGGRGGSGGSGGRGDNGKTCQDGQNGGDGGDGGPGGNGGQGGPVSLRLADRTLRDLVQVRSRGGEAGSGGYGGSGGSGGVFGSSSNGKCKTSSGKTGRKGSSGGSGRAGRDGRVDVQLATAQSLAMIADALAANPRFHLEGDAPAGEQPVPVKAVKKKNHR